MYSPEDLIRVLEDLGRRGPDIACVEAAVERGIRRRSRRQGAIRAVAVVVAVAAIAAGAVVGLRFDKTYEASDGGARLTPELAIPYKVPESIKDERAESWKIEGEIRWLYVGGRSLPIRGSDFAVGFQRTRPGRPPGISKDSYYETAPMKVAERSAELRMSYRRTELVWKGHGGWTRVVSATVARTVQVAESLTAGRTVGRPPISVALVPEGYAFTAGSWTTSRPGISPVDVDYLAYCPGGRFTHKKYDCYFVSPLVSGELEELPDGPEPNGDESGGSSECGIDRAPRAYQRFAPVRSVNGVEIRLSSEGCAAVREVGNTIWSITAPSGTLRHSDALARMAASIKIRR